MASETGRIYLPAARMSGHSLSDRGLNAWSAGTVLNSLAPRGSAGRIIVVEADDDRCVGDDDGIAAALGRNFQAAFYRRDRHRAVGQLLRDRCCVDTVRIRYA